MTARRVLTGLLAGLTVVLVATGLTGSMSKTAATPTLKITTVVSGLSIPWDLTWVGDVMLFDQRGGQVFSKAATAAPKPVSLLPRPEFFVAGEGGLLGLVADPQAAVNRRFYTCQAVSSGGQKLDVRVLAWKLRSDNTTADADGSPTKTTPVVAGLPLSSGRHSGCRLRFGPDGKLYVGTGDAAIGTNPQNRQSLGGKVLRVGSDGSIPTDNPFYAEGGNARYVWSFGHRNVQGLAFRPGTTELWSAEHGTSRDDEVNRIRPGANHGWDPVPGYDESTPMTDLKQFPNAAVAKWSSGSPTVATSGLSFMEGSAWGYWQGGMAVGLLKGQGIMVLVLDPSRNVAGVGRISGLGDYGRIRTVQQGPDGALYFTTSNGSGDRIGRIEPTAVAPAVTAGANVSPTGVTAARTGSSIYAYIRIPGGRVDYKRSTNDGGTWDSSWKQSGVTSANAPSAASSASGRIDLVTGNSAGEVIHSALVNGVKQNETNLGGEMTAATVSSLGDGTLDVYGLGRNGAVSRKHYDGDSWSGWTTLSGGAFTAAVGASPDRGSNATLLATRGVDGGTYVRTVTPTSNGSAWAKVAGQLWSAKALGDRFDGEQVVAGSLGSDSYLRLERGTVITALRLKITSAPDVVTRPDGSWLVFGRGTDNALQYVDSRTPGYPVKSLGGTVR